MHDTHTKGLLGELEFTTHLIRKGYTVLNPINPNSSYDLVIEKDGLFTRVQVKYLTPKKGVLMVELDRPMRKTQAYQEREVDSMGAYDPINHKFYLIPMSKIENKRTFYLRVENPKNKQVKGLNLSKDFEI